jgi:O-antigen ligase
MNTQNQNRLSCAKVSGWSDLWIRWALVALGFSLPLSTTGTSVLLGVILSLWIIGSDFRAQVRNMLAHPLALAALVLFGLYVFGLFYGKPSDRVIFDVAHFLLLAIFLMLFREEKLRHYALWGFLSATLILIILSYLSWLNLQHQMEAIGIYPHPGEPLVMIQDPITYGMFVSIAAFCWTVEASFTMSKAKKGALLFLAALAIFNLFGIIHNKTIYLVLPVLFGYFLISLWRWKGAAVLGLTVALIAVITWNFPATPIYQNVAKAVREYREWQPNQVDLTSTGQRMGFYCNTLEMIREYPFFGVGVGGFAQAYAKKVKDLGMIQTDNPHNEYLLVTVQLGLLGLAALLYVFYTQWRLAVLLPTRRETILARGVVLAFMVGCLFNSFLTDFDEGVFFVWISALLFSGFNPAGKDYS